MKTRFTKCLFMMAFILSAIPMFSQDYMTIYFKDGTKSRHKLSLIENIKQSTVDKEGVNHSDYVSYVINRTNGVEVKYLLVDIDSICYTKVDEEKLKQVVNTTCSSLMDLRESCSSVEDMAAYVDEIKAMDGVDDAYVYGGTLFVDIKGWCTIMFITPDPITEIDDDFLANISKSEPGKSKSVASKTQNINSNTRVVIANAQSKDLDRQDYTNYCYLRIKGELMEAGFDVLYEPNVDLEFYESSMYDYNSVYLITHGCYDGRNHWLATNQELCIEKYEWYAKYKQDNLDNYDHSEIALGVFDELRKNEETGLYETLYTVCPMINDCFIEQTNRKFRAGENNVFFNTSCQSLKGNMPGVRSYDNVPYTSDFRLATALRKNGIKKYYGYTETNCKGKEAGAYFYDNLVNGFSNYGALRTIPNNYTFEDKRERSDYEDAVLLGVPVDDDNTDFRFFVKTFTEPVDQNHLNQEFASTSSVKVNGVTTILSPEEGSVNWYITYSTNSDMTNPHTVQANYCLNASTERGNCVFEATFEGLNPNTTYYYQAKTFDGYAFNFGEVLSFTTPEDPSVTDFYANGIHYQITGSDEVEVILAGFDYEGDIVIPETISHAGKQYSVTSIGGYAFQYCRNLSSVTIGSRVKSIGEYAFEHCYNLSSIVIPDNVTTISAEAFTFCTSLKSVVIGNGVTSIGKSAFHKCKQLSSVLIGNKVKSIGEYAFEHCDNLSSIVIPDNVTTISAEAFAFCPALTSVVIGNGVASLEAYTFWDCKALSTVTIGNKVTDISTSAFCGCDNVKDLIYVNGCTTIVSTGLTSIENVILPSSATTIGKSAFEMCDKLQSVTIPQNVLHIEEYAFYGCSRLTEITIPNSTKSIGFVAFYKCEGAKKITIGSGMETLASYSFYDTHPTDFYCYALTPPEAEIMTFRDVSMESITLHVPSSALQAYKSKYPWKDFGSIVAIQ